MSDLQNLTPANTYKALLQIGDYTNGISGDTGANALQVSDGAGNNTSLALSTNRVGINNTSPSAELDVSGDVVADEYALDQTGSSSSAVAIHAPTTNELAIRTNTAERVRIDSSGNFGIGTTDPKVIHHISTSSDSANYAVTRHTADSQQFDIGVGGSTAAITGVRNKFYIFDSTLSQIRLLMDSSGNVTPGADDAQDFGSSSNRWDDIYATNTTIQSSRS